MNPLKRALDIGWSVAGLVALAPLLLAIALFVLWDDGRPVFFRQVRVGRRGWPFRMWKFRTMVTDAETRGHLITAAGDPRVTRVGRWLRATKLDELPQLVNVLAGDMSLVGPRPEVARYVDLYTPEQRRVLELVPGITDPASIAYRDEGAALAEAADPELTYVTELMPAKIRLNLEYAARASVWTDHGVILRTLRVLRPAARRRA